MKFCDLFAFVNGTGDKAKYLLMDHPVQKCILHVIGREKKRAACKRGYFAHCLYATEVDDTCGQYISKLPIITFACYRRHGTKLMERMPIEINFFSVLSQYNRLIIGDNESNVNDMLYDTNAVIENTFYDSQVQ